MKHHRENGGMARIEKIPIYMRWCNIECVASEVNARAEVFSKIVIDKVVSSPWIPGVLPFLKADRFGQLRYIITATPQSEMDIILDRLDLRNLIDGWYGSPVSKAQAIKYCLEEHSLRGKHCLSIGDSQTDYQAAIESEVNFLLMWSAEVSSFQASYRGEFMKAFGHE